MNSNKSKTKNNNEYVGLYRDDVIIESIYDQNTELTKLLVYKDGESQVVEKYNLGDKEILPVAMTNVIKAGGVLLPGEPIPYGNNQELFNEIRSYIHQYVDVEEDFEVIASLYCLLTYVYDDFSTVPYLRVIADFGSGKTRFLNTMGQICFRSIVSSGATTLAPIFRQLHKYKGTLIFDEADLQYSGKTNDLVKILNSGYEKGFPVYRCSEDNYDDVEAFDVFSPKIIASRDAFTDQALESRFYAYEMMQLKIREDIPRTLDSEFYRRGAELRAKGLMYRIQNKGKVELSQELIPNVQSRVQQISQPLLSIAPSEVEADVIRRYAKKLHDDVIHSRDNDWESDIIEAIDMLLRSKQGNRVTMGDIQSKINEGAEYQDKISAKHIGNICRKRFKFRSMRMARGITIDFNITSNTGKLEYWKRNFGLNESYTDNELVNEMNVKGRYDKNLDPEAWPL